MVTASVSRVVEHTPPEINRRIEEETERNIALFSHADKEELTRRIYALEQEWDIERALELNASSLVLGGLMVSLVGSRKWLVVPALVAVFLMQHSLQGWCPLLAVLRRLGFRTRKEIDREKNALKVLRGDYRELASRETSKETEWAGA